MWYWDSPQRVSKLRWSDVITKNLKDLNIRKEFAHKRVEWEMAIVPRKILLQKVQPIRCRQAYKRWVSYGKICHYIQHMFHQNLVCLRITNLKYKDHTSFYLLLWDESLNPGPLNKKGLHFFSYQCKMFTSKNQWIKTCCQ